MMAASSSRLNIDDPEADMVFEESQPEQSGLWAPPQEPGFVFEPPAEHISTPEAKGNEVPSSPVRQARPRDLGQDPAGSQEPEVSRTKYRKLDPKSQKDLDERTLIPNALTSKSDFQAMFQKYKAKWSQLRAETHGVQRGETYDVLTQTELKMKFVGEQVPHWGTPLRRLGAAAVHLYNRRLLDLSERDHVQILWMACGEYLLRVHEGGQLYIYQSAFGYFRQFEGLPPPHLFEIVRQFFVLLEGIFRNFKGHVPRDDKSVLKAMDAIVLGKTFEELLATCESACAWNKGNNLLKKDTMKKLAAAQAEVATADGAAPDEIHIPAGNMVEELEEALGLPGTLGGAAFGEGEPAAPSTPGQNLETKDEQPAQLEVGGSSGQKPVQPWYIVVAQSISRFSPTLIKKLEHNKIIPFLSEWCVTPKTAVAGVAHPDCILLYDSEGKPVVYLKDKKDDEGKVVESARSASANLYVGIERNLVDDVDPVLEAAIGRLEKIYSETFWAIPAAFELGQACLALAKRGLNVNQITLYLGPGGVGLSKFTAHLEAMLGTDNHDTFDPNVFYSDDELRKQVPQMAGHFVFTGQERPSGSKQAVREDLLKKFCTGEGVAGRLPYGILTKMHNIIGWKRLECNKLIEFQDITEDNFESILRRFAVVQIQARFFEKAQLSGVDLDPDTRGVFCRDPELDSFYTSGPACAGGLKIQAAFEEINGKQDCLDIVQHYTRGGGDKGVSMKYMRECCGLKPLHEASLLGDPAEEEVAPEVVSLNLGAAKAEVEEGPKEDSAMLVKTNLVVYAALLDKNLDAMTPSYLAQVKKTGDPTAKKEVWAKMQTSPMWRSASRGKSTASLFPKLQTKQPFGVLFAPGRHALAASALDSFVKVPESNQVTTLQEQYDLEPLQLFVVNQKILKSNTDLGVSTLLAEVRKHRSKRLGHWNPEMAAVLEKKANKWRDFNQCSDHYIARLNKDASTQAKRRKLATKSSSSGLKTESLQVEYGYTKDWRGRRYSQTPNSAQGMSQILQNLLLAHTLDIDVKNSIFVLLKQAVDRLEVKYSAEVFKGCLDTLSALASDRAKFCREEMGVNEVTGKAVLHSMVNGSACPEDYKDQPGVQKLRDLSRFLRWLACSLMPKEFEAIMEDKQKDKGWAEATMSATLYFAIEDHILSSLVKVVQAKETTHLSLHFDGVRVDKTRVELEGGDGDHFCRFLEKAILEDTGYEVHLAVKEHLSCLQLVSKACPNPEKLIQPSDHMLLKVGNCIPCALGAVLGIDLLVGKLTDAGQGDGYKPPGGVRSYREVASLAGCTLSPAATWSKSEATGSWLVHTFLAGKPHCFTMVFEAAGSVQVHHAGACYQVDKEEMLGYMEKCLDKNFMVFLKVNDSGGSTDGVLPLLDLQA